MLVLMKVLGLQAAWWGCGAAYASSDRQLLLRAPMDKRLGWGLFVLGAVIATSAFSIVHDPLTGSVYWVCASMVSWTLLVLATPHLAQRGWLLGWGTLLMLIASVLG